MENILNCEPKSEFNRKDFVPMEYLDVQPIPLSLMHRLS